MTNTSNKFDRFEIWLDAVAHRFFVFWNKHKVGILGTIAFNLVLAILFFILELSGSSNIRYAEVNVDFERQYEILPEPPPEEKEPLLPDDALDPTKEYEAIKNIAIDATKDDLNAGLTDEKNIDADELYQEAERIREQMEENRQRWEEEQDVLTEEIPNVEEKIIPEQDETQFKGPSVISYFLKDRKAMHLPVPSYKCENGGRVVVDIEVLRNGTVSHASIDAASSVIDDCINRAAIAAAKKSIFTVSGIAPSRQKGSITYLFVPQY